MTESLHLDQQNRLLALDVEQSFIVQAPAGSGKTELLMQRFLALLASSDTQPENILAITFTNKAAREMKERILFALEQAETEAPLEMHKKQTWQLARAVLDKDRTLDWNLLTHPSRLKIQTIDAFCLGLTQAMPFLSTLGAELSITTDIEPYYVMAAENLLAHLETDSPLAPSLFTLLQHLDNQLEKTKSLLVDILKIRDQWLPYLVGDFASSLSHYLQNSLQNLIEDEINLLCQQLPKEIEPMVLNLLNHLACAENRTLLHHQEASLRDWQRLAACLLTTTDTLRVRLNFSHLDKTTLEDFRQRLEDHSYWVSLLAKIRKLPTMDNDDQSYTLLQDLVILLPYLVAELNLVFQKEESIDFSAVAEHALLALGDDESPTDLALALDQKIQHILIDEFQDTSITQFRLLNKLTVDWQENDGRTLFLVGDPMQSIYRFRQAEVSLFLRVKTQGLRQLKLRPLSLMANFRSSSEIVNWNNHVFAKLFPDEDNLDHGAICYHRSVAIKQTNAPNSIVSLAFDKQNKAAQATAMVHIIRSILAETPQKTIAVLVKARSHLPELLALLNAEHIPYQAVEIEQLQHKETVQDLLSLTLALLNLADRLSWLSLLRCPWFGLCLTDLTHIASAANLTIYAALNDTRIFSLLSPDGQKRVALRLPALQKSLQHQGEAAFSVWIEETWRALEGNRLLANDTAGPDSELFFSTLRTFDEQGIWPQPQGLKDKFATLFATPLDTQSSALQIMTIHKAKGLEFDCVILPRLEASPPIESKPLLTWLERTRDNGDTDLLLAPIPAVEENNTPLYDYIRLKNKAKLAFENTRVLYVATTRAKEKLYLLYGIDIKDNEVKPPSKGSFLHELWPILQPEIKLHQEAALPFSDTSTPTADTVKQSPELKRFILESEPKAVSSENSAHPLSPHSKYAFSILNDATAQHVGTVLHRILCILSQQSAYTLINYPATAIECQLLAVGMQQDRVKAATTIILNALSKMSQDARAQWILAPTHLEAHSEYALTAKVEGIHKQFIIDRTFIDETGNRWIVDYKSTEPKSNESMDVFYQHMQEQYAPQLHAYAQLFTQLDTRPICLGLYFPLFQGWYSWEYRLQSPELLV